MSDRDAHVPPSGGEPAVPGWERDRPRVVFSTSYWISWIGLVLGVTAISTWLFVLPAELGGNIENPYKGAALHLILPFVLVGGVVTTSAGIVLGRRPIRQRLGAVVVDRRTAARATNSWPWRKSPRTF